MNKEKAIVFLYEMGAYFAAKASNSKEDSEIQSAMQNSQNCFTIALKLKMDEL